MTTKNINRPESSVEDLQQIDEPPLFEVLLHNDDYTTMDFVIAILQTVFAKNEEQATNIMLNVHKKGVGIAGIYIRDVAETKVAIVHDWARQEGHPLRCSIRKV